MISPMELFKAQERAERTDLTPIRAFENVSVFHSDDLLVCKILTTKYQIGLMTLFTPQGPAIIVNSAFLKLPQELQDGALASEVSHLLLHHYNKSMISEEQRLNLEFKADFHAMNKLKKDIKGFLKHFLEVRTDLNSDAKKQIEERINKLNYIQ